MQGFILEEDIKRVKESTDILDVISPYVKFKRQGSGAYVGLCPFHPEKTPSFTVRPHVNRYHCFGCSKDGDAIGFLIDYNSMTYPDAIEFLAARIGIQLRYENRGTAYKKPEGPSRMRLIQANAEAHKFFEANLYANNANAERARKLLLDRNFTINQIRTFRVGYAPNSWDALLKHMQNVGFTREELTTVGLTADGRNGMYDVFRGRVIWPICNATDEVIGFGGRTMSEDKKEAKYINTKESPIYKKSHVLYGIDMAKRAISDKKCVVIVEGYTDVMAMKLSGIDYAVAPCGTSFTADHVQVLRRMMGDVSKTDSLLAGKSKVIFTFDGDSAGKKATMRAFDKDQEFLTQTYVAIAEDGMDPCDLRMKMGDKAVRELIENARPMYEYAIKTAIDNYDLNTAEGKVFALKASVPIIGDIRDSALKSEYLRQLASWIDMDEKQVKDEFVRTAKTRRKDAKTNLFKLPIPAQNVDSEQQVSAKNANNAQNVTVSNQNTPSDAHNTKQKLLEANILAFLLQNAERVSPNLYTAQNAEITADLFSNPKLKSVYEMFLNLTLETDVKRALRDLLPALTDDLRETANYLMFMNTPEIVPKHVDQYLKDSVSGLKKAELNHRISLLNEKMKTLPKDSVGFKNALAEFQELQRKLRG
ncbi:MAG: DNA primase [Bifidobacteriaceae bacterium]|nr:DNA primase [Bifidobacteriaceae bacterium]